jgi:hypothetical protein
MIRQAGPSIVLSVLIVCFFAVALFQRDLPRAQFGRPKLPVRDSRARSSLRPALGRSPSGQGTKVRSRAASAPPDERNEGQKLSGRQMTQPRGATLPPGKLRQASARAPGQQQPTKTVARHGPGSAFTTAQRSESIEDVSARVYGTVEMADWLWRANRDTLPRRDSPVAEGMLLRTPDIQTALRK